MESPHQTTSSATQLHYAPPPGGLRRLFALRGLLIAILILAAAKLAIFVFPAQWQALQQRRLMQRQQQCRSVCLSFTRPAGTVVYDEDLDRANTLLTSGGYIDAALSMGGAPGAALLPTPVWDAYSATLSGIVRPALPPVAPIIFLHERTSPAGQRRLVVVQVGRATGQPDNFIYFHPYVDGSASAAVSMSSPLGSTTLLVHPASGPRLLEMFRTPTETTALYAGQIDANDPSHFTIDYLLNNRMETIDGWLNDDDTVSLLPRCGSVGQRILDAGRRGQFAVGESQIRQYQYDDRNRAAHRRAGAKGHKAAGAVRHGSDPRSAGAGVRGDVCARCRCQLAPRVGVTARRPRWIKQSFHCRSDAVRRRAVLTLSRRA
jgi:hypothetical protein